MRPLISRFKALIALVLWCASTAAMAQGGGAMAAHFKATRIELNEEIAADFSTVRTYTVEREALSQNGAIGIGRQGLSFNADMESLEILEAYTEKSDGQRWPLRDSDILKQIGILAPGTQVSLPNQHVWQLTYPNVQVGDKTLVRYRLTVKTPALPGWLSNLDFLSNDLDYDDFKVTLSAPIDMPIQVYAKGLRQTTRIVGQRREWILEGQQSSFASDFSLANALKVLPTWMYSTLPTRAALGDVFAQTMRQKIAITPEIQALADQITAGKSSTFDKAQAIYQWMGKEIRYVAIFLGNGGFVPHDLESVLKNRYGDCKDQTSLMLALLQAAKIEAAPALINTVHADWAPPVAATLYNHVIVYIPELSLYADPTAAAQIPFSKLPWADAAKPVVVGLREGAQDQKTPAFAAQDNRVSVQSVWTIDAQGKANVDMKSQALGEAGTTMQNHLAQIPPGFSGAAVERILKQANLHGRGFLQHPEINRQTQAQEFSAQVEIDNYLANSTGASLNPHPAIPSLPLYVTSNLGPEGGSNRRFDMLCTPIHVEETFTLNLPPGAEVLAVPKSLRLVQAGLRYVSEYQAEGATIRGTRRFTREPTESGHICNLKEIADRQAIVAAIRKDLRSTVLFK